MQVSIMSILLNSVFHYAADSYAEMDKTGWLRNLLEYDSTGHITFFEPKDL